MADRQQNKSVQELIPNFKKKMDEIDDLIEISSELDQKMLKLISNKPTTKKGSANDYWLSLVNKIPSKVRGIILFFRINNFSYNPFILIATLIIIIISLGTYYSISKKNSIGISKNPQPQATHANVISNKQIPTIKVDVAKDETPTTLPTPTETPIIESNNKDKDIENTSTKNKRLERTSNNTNAINSIEEQIAKILTGVENNIDRIPNNRSSLSQNIFLSNIENVFVSNLIEEDLRTELQKLIKKSNKLKLTNENECQGTLKWSFSQPNTIIISTTNNPLLWKKKIGNYGSPKEKAKDIVYSLTESIEESKKIQVIINTSLMYLP